MSRNLKRRYKKGGAVSHVRFRRLPHPSRDRTEHVETPIAVIHSNFRLLFGVPTMMGGGRWAMRRNEKRDETEPGN